MTSLQTFGALETWNAENINKVIKEIGRELGLEMKIVNQVLRYALAGLESGVGVHVIIEILGKERVRQRLETCKVHPKGDNTH